MKTGRTEHRAVRISLVTGFSTILSITFQIVSVPICLNYWGQEAYGEWLALFSAFLLLRSLDAGYVAYVGNKLNYLYHQDTNALRQHLASAVAGIGLIGAAQIFLATSTIFSDKLAAFLGMQAEMPAAFQDRLGLLVLMTSWVLTGSYVGIVHRLQIPAGLMYQAAWWSMAFQVSQFAAIMGASLLKLGLLQTSFLFALSQIFIYVTSAIYIRNKLPSYYPWWHGGRVRIGLKDLRQSVMLTVSNVIQQGTSNGVVLLVSTLAGPTVVPAFTSVRTLTNLWTNLTNVLTAPLLPDVVRFHAKNETRKLVAINQAHWVVVGSIVNWGVLLTYPLLQSLYDYWTGHAVPLDKSLLCLLLASVVTMSVGALMTMYLNGINSLRIVLCIAIARSVLTLGGGLLAYPVLGLAGLGLSVLAGEFVVLMMTIYFLTKHELPTNEINTHALGLVPAALGAGSVLLFLVCEGFGLLSNLRTWPLAFAGVTVASLWGWQRLDLDVKTRLKMLIQNKFANQINYGK